VVVAIARLEYSRGLPQRISCDNGSEFSGGQMDLWAYTHKVQMDFNRRGKPTDNATVESSMPGDGIIMSIVLTVLSRA
jgi:putative transposase